MTDGLDIVKLGGSHALSPSLGRWLADIAASARPVVIVPGGGPFADAVRKAQPIMAFDDAAAHDMALMAMAQYGRSLVSLCDRLIYADDLAGVRRALSDSATPVWSPWPMLRDHPGLLRTWDITSDSLAIWLATELRASRVVLVKHRAAPDDRSPAALARDGFVDKAFPRFAARFEGRIEFRGPADLATAETLTLHATATARVPAATTS